MHPRIEVWELIHAIEDVSDELFEEEPRRHPDAAT